MDREIKFRAWDIHRKKMIFGPTDNNPNASWILALMGLNIPIMQYTGLKDRNGKDIYDKDIVKLCFGIPPTFDTLLIEYADDETVGDISVSGWWMRNIRPNGVSGSLCKTYENDLEIIGNATDNPELLTEKSHA